MVQFSGSTSICQAFEVGNPDGQRADSLTFSTNSGFLESVEKDSRPRPSFPLQAVQSVSHVRQPTSKVDTEDHIWGIGIAGVVFLRY